MTNIITLCYFNCHIRWWHSNPIEAVEWFKEKYPDRYKKLREISKENLPKPEPNTIKQYLEQFI